jgi:phosphoribosyl 1,2-cyclic phosphodiesterase
MRIKLWGCRGSIATPGPTTLRYGGNTTCLEIRTADGQVIIVDAGSGLRPLGRALRREAGTTQLRFFITHSHWDHLVGFPFFEPAYLSRYTITFCGGAHAQNAIRQYLNRQMRPPYFPVSFNLLKAQFDFRCEQRARHKTGICSLGGLQVIPVALSHPNGGFGFKFVERQKTFVFLTDNELRVRHPGGLSRRTYEAFCRGADLLIHDAQYTDEEYRVTRGWGHSTYGDATDLAIRAAVRRLGLFHHDPDRTDDELDRQVRACRKRIREAGSAADCFACAEGMVVDL